MTTETTELTTGQDFDWLDELTDEQLAELRNQVCERAIRRLGYRDPEEATSTPPPAPLPTPPPAGDGKAHFNLDLYAGPHRGRVKPKAWVKRVTGCDPSKKNGFGIDGEFLRDWSGELPEGVLLVAGAHGGTHGSWTTTYALLRTKQGGSCEVKNGDQVFRCQGVELLATSTDKVDEAAAVVEFPVLKPAMKSRMFPVFYGINKALA